MAEHHPKPKPYPIPDNFPFTWDNPADAHLPLDQDRQHMPTPMTPLSGWLAEKYWGPGASAGLAVDDQPIMMHIRRVNTYYYMGVTPSVPMKQMEDAGKGRGHPEISSPRVR